jgi:hypothetical protein
MTQMVIPTGIDQLRVRPFDLGICLPLIPEAFEPQSSDRPEAHPDVSR